MMVEKAEGRAYADAGEKGAESEEFSDRFGKLMDMISDACDKMDAVGERMDRMDARLDSIEDLKKEDKKDAAKKDEDEEEEKEERKDRRKDESEEEEEKKDGIEDIKEAKGDAEEEPEEKGEPEETVADKKRKDSRRKDGEEEEEKEEREDARRDAYSDSYMRLEASQADIRSSIRNLERRMPKVLSSEERERFAAIQEKADPAFQAFGDRAGPPLEGEGVIAYQQRLIAKLQKHSPKWAKGRITSIADADFLDSIATEVYADSIMAARRGAELPPGQMRRIEKTSAAGHTIYEYEGDSPSAWMNAFAGNFLRSTGDFRTPR